MSAAAPLIGINLPWLGNAYGHDLGLNQAYLDWPVEFDWWRTDRLFALLHSRGIALVRFWLFEDGEGLLVDERGLVTGLDPVFQENLNAFVQLAERWNMRVFWTLLDANSLRRRYDLTTRLILSTPEGVQAFIDHALTPVLHQISRVAWAIDLCNEPEAMVAGHLGNGTGLGVDWWELTPQLLALCQAIRKRRGNLAITIGSGFQEHRCLAAGRYAELGIDALSFHAHAHEGPMPAAATLSDGLPVIVGELGWPLPGSWSRDRAGWEQAQHRLTDRLKQAIEAGYAAIFLWFLSDMSGNPESLVCDGEVGLPLELVARFQETGALARPDQVSALSTRWATAAPATGAAVYEVPKPSPAIAEGVHHGV